MGADGANSIVARNLGLNPIDVRHIGIQADIPLPEFASINSLNQKTIALDWGVIDDGYGWVFPNKKSVSIGVMGRSDLGNKIKKYHDHWMEYLGFHPHEFHLKAHIIPHRISNKPIVKDKGILIGDAAGLTDYWTGEGIYYAVKSSKIASEQIVKFFNGEQEALKNYEIIIDEVIMPELRTSYSFSKIFRYVSWPAFYFIKRYSYPWDLLCRIMRGDRTFFDIKKRLRPDILLQKIFLGSKRNK